MVADGVNANLPLNTGGDQKRNNDSYESMDVFFRDGHHFRFKKPHGYSSTVI